MPIYENYAYNLKNHAKYKILQIIGIIFINGHFISHIALTIGPYYPYGEYASIALF